MLVSRKYLAALIHFFPRELSTRIYVAQFIHQCAILLLSTLTPCNRTQPVAEKFVQRSVLAPGFLTGKLNVGLVGSKCYVLSHENSVHDTRVSHKHVPPLAARVDSQSGF